MGLLTKDDAKLYRCFFKEMAMLRGIDVLYLYPTEKSSTETTIYGEILPNYSQPEKISIIFEQNPSIRTLKKVGWVSEKPQDNPYIAHLPYDTPNLQVKSLIAIPPERDFEKAKFFEIEEITSLIEFPDCYICKIAPKVLTKESKDEYSQSNYNYFDTEDQPINDEPANAKRDSYYKFLKENNNNES